MATSVARSKRGRFVLHSRSPLGDVRKRACYNRRVPISRRLVGLILIYITLDLSVASIPGAFVFDASDSVETLQRSRAETPVRVAAFTLGGPQRDGVRLVEEVAPELPVKRSPVGQRIRLLPGRALRTAEPPPLSEDSD